MVGWGAKAAQGEGREGDGEEDVRRAPLSVSASRTGVRGPTATGVLAWLVSIRRWIRRVLQKKN